MNAATESCFVIRPIGEEGTDERKHADDRFEHLIKPACLSCGYKEVVHAGEIAAPGMITRDVINRLYESALVVADLTGNNPNVFYELSFRHSLPKPCVCISEVRSDKEHLPFDVGDSRTVLYHPSSEFGAQQEIRTRVENAIRAAVSLGERIETPISVVMDSKVLSRGSPMERAVNATRVNCERIIDMLGDIDKPVDFKVYEILENFRIGFGLNCLEDFVNYLQNTPEPNRDEVLARVRHIEGFINNGMPNIQNELRSVVIKYLRALQ